MRDWNPTQTELLQADQSLQAPTMQSWAQLLVSMVVGQLPWQPGSRMVRVRLWVYPSHVLHCDQSDTMHGVLVPQVCVLMVGGHGAPPPLGCWRIGRLLS